MPVLSERDWAFWEENGYVVIPNAVPQANLDIPGDGWRRSGVVVQVQAVYA